MPAREPDATAVRSADTNASTTKDSSRGLLSNEKYARRVVTMKLGESQHHDSSPTNGREVDRTACFRVNAELLCTREQHNRWYQRI